MLPLESRKGHTFHSERHNKIPSQYERLVQDTPTHEKFFKRLILQWAKNALMHGMQFAL
jgi:hypothetical protein